MKLFSIFSDFKLDACKICSVVVFVCNFMLPSSCVKINFETTCGIVLMHLRIFQYLVQLKDACRVKFDYCLGLCLQGEV